MIRVLMLATALIGSAQIAKAAPSTADMVGTVAAGNGIHRTNNYECGGSAALAVFRRPAATTATPNPTAIIGGVSVRYFLVATGVESQNHLGVARLIFNNTSSGQITFDYDADGNPALAGESVPFASYSQKWDAAQDSIAIKFTIIFPNCQVPITALFRS